MAHKSGREVETFKLVCFKVQQKELGKYSWGYFLLHQAVAFMLDSNWWEPRPRKMWGNGISSRGNGKCRRFKLKYIWHSKEQKPGPVWLEELKERKRGSWKCGVSAKWCWAFQVFYCKCNGRSLRKLKTESNMGHLVFLKDDSHNKENNRALRSPGKTRYGGENGPARRQWKRRSGLRLGMYFGSRDANSLPSLSFLRESHYIVSWETDFTQ